VQNLFLKSRRGDVENAAAAPTQRRRKENRIVNWTLELVVVPVSDVDRAKSFYMDQLGFNLEVDRWMSETFRIVQLTPPGSACSIAIGTGLADSKPGSLKGLQLVVNDVRAARALLVERGVACSDVQIFDAGGPRPPREGDDLNYAGFVFFNDPDGNGWAVQQITARE
jgi:catechol 2,3-dioxygenase-like lactoylglutathione lyase family enzyme